MSALLAPPGPPPATDRHCATTVEAPATRHPTLATICGVIVLLALAWPLCSMLHAMATASLWGDEIYSVLYFSGLGPWPVVTCYAKPNNHIFFNLLNSLTPGSGSFDPLRARLWSFVAVLGGLAWTVGFFARRGRLLEGALLVAFVVLDPFTMDLALQARGYGFLHFCALGCLWLGAGYLESPCRTRLVVLAVLVVLGTWTIPVFVAFGLGFLILLWIASRRREVLTCAAAAFLGIALLHVPVLKAILGFSSTYAQMWGEAEEPVTWLVRWLRNVLAGPTWLAGSACLLAVLGTLRRCPTPSLRSVRIGMIAAGLAICGALLLRTTPVRTMVFTTVVVGTALALLLGDLVRSVRPPVLRALGVFALAAAMVVLAVRQAVGFRYVPVDNWLEVAATIRELAPARTPLFVKGEAYLLRVYLPANEYPDAPALDPVQFRSGRLWVVDADIRATPEQRFKAADLAPQHGIDIDVPQRRAGFQRISYCRPP